VGGRGRRQQQQRRRRHVLLRQRPLPRRGLTPQPAAAEIDSLDAGRGFGRPVGRPARPGGGGAADGWSLEVGTRPIMPQCGRRDAARQGYLLGAAAAQARRGSMPAAGTPIHLPASATWIWAATPGRHGPRSRPDVRPAGRHWPPRCLSPCTPPIHSRTTSLVTAGTGAPPPPTHLARPLSLSVPDSDALQADPASHLGLGNGTPGPTAGVGLMSCPGGGASSLILSADSRPSRCRRGAAPLRPPAAAEEGAASAAGLPTGPMETRSGVKSALPTMQDLCLDGVGFRQPGPPVQTSPQH
jgi:hypothetical protein